jgi:hypothetical protein
MATFKATDADGKPINVEFPNANGRAAAAASRPVALSSEDLAALQSISGALSADTIVAPATLTTVGQAVEVNTQGKSFAAFNVTANVNVTLAFQALAPDGTTWVNVNGYPFTGGAAASSLPANATGAWLVPCGAFPKVRLAVTAVSTTPSATAAGAAGVGGNEQLLLTALGGSLPGGTNSIGNLNAPPQGTYIGTVLNEGNVATYRYEAVGITPAATPTDIFTLQGSASKVIKVKRVIVSGEATAAAQVVANLVRRSTANTAGTSTAPVIAQSDNADAAPFGAIKLYSVNPTALGTVVATIISRRVGLNPNSALPASAIELSFGVRNDKPIILRGATDFLAINLAGAALPAGTKLDIAIEWTEE